MLIIDINLYYNGSFSNFKEFTYLSQGMTHNKNRKVEHNWLMGAKVITKVSRDNRLIVRISAAFLMLNGPQNCFKIFFDR
jgi:hypothetical protein